MTLNLITSVYECVTMMAVDVGHLPGSAEYVVVVVQLEVVVGRHCMVDPPEEKTNKVYSFYNWMKIAFILTKCIKYIHIPLRYT